MGDIAMYGTETLNPKARSPPKKSDNTTKNEGPKAKGTAEIMHLKQSSCMVL